MVEILNKEIKVEKIIGRESGATTFRGLLLSYINQIRNKRLYLQGVDAQFLLEELLGHYDRLHKASVVLKPWKGKSSIEYIEKVDSFDIITFQKPDQDSEPKRVITNISKEEINTVIEAINTCKQRKDKKGEYYLHSVDIAEQFCILSGLKYNLKGHCLFTDRVFEYERFFGCRKFHKNLNLSLRLLDFHGVIKYRGKRSIILNNKFKFYK